MSPCAPIPLTQGLNQSLIPHTGEADTAHPGTGKTPHAPACLAPTLALPAITAHLLTAEGTQGRGFGGGDGGQDPRLCCWRLLIAAG